MAQDGDGLAALPPSRGIPVSVLESFRSWWAVGAKESAASEERLLRKLPFYVGKGGTEAEETGEVTARSSMVALAGRGQYINTLSMLPNKGTESGSGTAVVLLHGYGAGLGFFFRNFGALGAWAGRRQRAVYALDWLGMGRSARVPFRVRARREDVAGRVGEAEGFFVESLEEWREKMGLGRVTLVGHSLGAYLSVVYALKYPERVERLVLLSPVGVPANPNVTAPVQEATAKSGGKGVTVQGVYARTETEKRGESRLRRLVTHLWEEGWSPFQIVRSSLFFGPMLVGKYSTRRFGGLTEEETRDMHDYILNITMAKGSGEYCISHILAPGAYARMPLVDRIRGLKIPVTFIYGEHDWMDADGGRRAIEELNAGGNREGRIWIVPGAGHHVYLDNAEAVNTLVVGELERDATERRRRQ